MTEILAKILLYIAFVLIFILFIPIIILCLPLIPLGVIADCFAETFHG